MTAALIPPGAPEFVGKFHQFRYSAYRLETLQSYGNSGEDADFAAFVAGRPKPPNPGHEQWQAMVRANLAAGRIMQRVHVVIEPLSQYLQLELTWGYGPNAAAGEDIRIIAVRRGERWPLDVPEGTDYWLFDSAELYQQHYDADGTWVGTEIVTDPARIVTACHWRDAALHHSMPWRDYLADRPELARHVPTPEMAP
ncbi:MAG TPA: hypothetical protein VFQ77_10115 [Pseudonocardiaceae bacterium]|nr:hypothetical protein [Pseudonocardiaceae bacterium]